ncbi:hypothetical protein [Thermococcus camini]|nr:hypothetical protein [Thermococcus camini]
MSYLRMNGEALWEGENFTLLEYKTDEGKEGKIYVKDGFVCTKVNGGEACSGPLIPGPSHFEVIFSGGTLYVTQWDKNLLTLELGAKGLHPKLFLGLPSEKLYGMEIYAREPVPWKEENKPPGLLIGVLIIIGGIAAIVKMLERR